MPTSIERADIGACVIWAADVVRPGVHRRNTRIDHLGATQPHAAISIFRRVLLALRRALSGNSLVPAPP